MTSWRRRCRNDPRPITLVVGDGAHLAYACFTEQGIPCRMAPPHLIMQNAASVALEAEALAAQGKLVSAQELEAFYLRPPQADPPEKETDADSITSSNFLI